MKAFEENLRKSRLINGGFFVLSNKIFEYIKDDQTIFEREPLIKLCAEKELMAFKHEKFYIVWTLLEIS